MSRLVSPDSSRNSDPFPTPPFYSAQAGRPLAARNGCHGRGTITVTRLKHWNRAGTSKSNWGIFQRLDNRAPYDGTGIALAIVRKAAERWGGS